MCTGQGVNNFEVGEFTLSSGALLLNSHVEDVLSGGLSGITVHSAHRPHPDFTNAIHCGIQTWAKLELRSAVHCDCVVLCRSKAMYMCKKTIRRSSYRGKSSETVWSSPYECRAKQKTSTRLPKGVSRHVYNSTIAVTVVHQNYLSQKVVFRHRGMIAW